MKADTVAALLQVIKAALVDVDHAGLEAEILLSHVLAKPRSFLWAHPEFIVKDIAALQQLLQRRIAGEPIAYILGEKEFYGYDFKVNQSTLIPRPETEKLVDIVLELLSGDLQNIADLGTGSGAIAITLAKQRPAWQVVATDQSDAALAVAKENAKHLQAKNIEFYHGDWCDALPVKRFDAIVSNPPYIRKNDLHLQQGDVRFEPDSALVSGVTGLDAIKVIITQAVNYLSPCGLLVFEHGYDQAQAVFQLLQAQGYRDIRCYTDLAGHDRVTVANNRA